MTLLQTIIIAIVEGLTEFLPVSSTGHMLIAENLLGVENSAFVRAFTVIIQFGAILSVVVLYWNRFFRLDHTPAPVGSTAWQKVKHKWNFYWLLIVAFIPTGVIGFVVKKSGMIDFMLNPVNAIWIVPIMVKKYRKHQLSLLFSLYIVLKLFQLISILVFLCHVEDYLAPCSRLFAPMPAAL